MPSGLIRRWFRKRPASPKKVSRKLKRSGAELSACLGTRNRGCVYLAVLDSWHRRQIGFLPAPAGDAGQSISGKFAGLNNGPLEILVLTAKTSA
ncbi:MAG: hypothetical protein WCD20_08895, partial [Rhodomicrobium sp.]